MSLRISASAHATNPSTSHVPIAAKPYAPLKGLRRAGALAAAAIGGAALVAACSTAPSSAPATKPATRSHATQKATNTMPACSYAVTSAVQPIMGAALSAAQPIPARWKLSISPNGTVYVQNLASGQKSYLSPAQVMNLHIPANLAPSITATGTYASGQANSGTVAVSLNLNGAGGQSATPSCSMAFSAQLRP